MMMPITSRWKQYFKDHHEGLGTTYERFILQQYFKKIQRKYSIQSVLEVPSFGMTGISGINSMWWAANGAQVTIVDDIMERIALIENIWKGLSIEVKITYNSNSFTSLPFTDKFYDMGWNFASLWFVPDLEKFLKELVRITRKVIFICVPNGLNVFHMVRIASQKKSTTIHTDNIKPDKIIRIMQMLDWRTVDRGFLDIPPWPDIAMNKEDLLKKIGLKQLSKKMKKGEDDKICILDYFSEKKKDMEKDLLKYAFLENLPLIIARFWAHHQYFTFVPK